MTGWKKIARGMLGTGLAFGVGIGAVATLAGLAAVVFGDASLFDLRFAGRLGVAGFVLGVGFSGILALVSRNKRFAELTVPRMASIGAGAGLLYFLLISFNGAGVWSLQTALVNFFLLTGMGASAAAGVLIVARRSQSVLGAGEETLSLGEGAADFSRATSSERDESVIHNRSNDA